MLKQWTETDQTFANRHDAPALHEERAHLRASFVATERARLNVFQRLVRQWETIHPYNGVQALKIRGNVDAELCKQSWFEALDSLNLGVVCVGADSYHHRCLNGEAMHHGVVFSPRGTRLDEFITRQLNRPFDLAGGVPFRPFVIQDEGYFWMGLSYQHWVADSASIRVLVHEWFTRQFDPARCLHRPMRFHAGGYLSLFGPHREGSPPLGVLLSSLRWPSQFKKVRRIEDREKFADMRLRYSIASAPDGLIESLRDVARNKGATVNDLFLAAIAIACDEFVPATRRFRRQELAIGSIVDLRQKSNQPLGDLFDLLLGFTSITCTSPQLSRVADLIESITRQTRQQKRSGLAMASCLRMFVGLTAGKYLPRQKAIEFYRKRVPLAGASSNVNLNRCWASRYANGLVLDYLRGAPTGPMTPIVFATTTLANHLSIGITSRTSVVPPETAMRMAEKFISILTDLCRQA